ncbi:MAG: hypothetical protein JNK82_30160 [Myxococcaceae bacterium]|nr:hypothetical protein [Myxococcaceae bacterium]
MRTRVAASVFALLLSCRSAGPDTNSTSIEAPAEVAFGRCPVGESVQRTLGVTNNSLHPVSVTFGSPAFFVVRSQKPLEISAAGFVDVEVEFRPTAAGSRSEVLSLDAEGVRLTTVLIAEGIEACSGEDSCSRQVFSAVEQQCVAVTSPDGEACTGRCVTAGSCIGGRCYGAATQCDDGDFCTVDACGSAGECFHQPRICPADNACQVGSCDSTAGRCTSLPVADGVACGPSDCSTAHVCVAGACVVRNRPGVDVDIDCRYVDLSVGPQNACGVTRRGQVRCWGFGETITAAGVLSSLEYMGPATVFAGAAGFERVSADRICAWGLDGGRCGSTAAIPAGHPALADVVAVDGTSLVTRGGQLIAFDIQWWPTGRVLIDGGVVDGVGDPYRGVAVKSDGTVWAWGGGSGTPTSPAQVQGPTEAVSIPVRGTLLDRDGGLWRHDSPTRYERVAHAGVSSAAFWGARLCFVRDGAPECLPSAALPWSHVAKLGAHQDLICALLTDGTIECLGSNQNRLLSVVGLYLAPRCYWMGVSCGACR